MDQQKKNQRNADLFLSVLIRVYLWFHRK